MLWNSRKSKMVDPNDARFSAPGDMSPRIRQFAAETHQPEPTTIGELVRCCLESLALCYGDTVDQLERVVGKSVSSLHIVGGGSQNDLLNQMTAAAVGHPVLAGPIEATATGNVVLANRIGLNRAGDARLQNLGDGVFIQGADGNRIGRSDEGAEQ